MYRKYIRNFIKTCLSDLSKLFRMYSSFRIKTTNTLNRNRFSLTNNIYIQIKTMEAEKDLKVMVKNIVKNSLQPQIAVLKAHKSTGNDEKDF